VQSAIQDVHDEFAQTVLSADKGIVDVYWVRKQQTAEEMQATIKQQAEMLTELNEQYRIIRENLER